MPSNPINLKVYCFKPSPLFFYRGRVFSALAKSLEILPALTIPQRVAIFLIFYCINRFLFLVDSRSQQLASGLHYSLLRYG